MSEFFHRFALGFAIIVLGLWGVVLIVQPELVHDFLTKEPMNHTYAGMMGAALLGLALMSAAMLTKLLSPARALGLSVGILVATTIYLMFFTHHMLVTPLTSMSMVAAGAVALFLLF